MLDPYFVGRDAQGKWFPPATETEQVLAVMALVQQVGGPRADINLHKLMLTAYRENMGVSMDVVAEPKERAEAAAAAIAATRATSASLQRCLGGARA